MYMKLSKEKRFQLYAYFNRISIYTSVLEPPPYTYTTEHLLKTVRQVDNRKLSIVFLKLPTFIPTIPLNALSVSCNLCKYLHQ